LRTKELDYDYVEKHLPDIINIIETNNLTQVETAIPIFAAVQMAANDNQRILFSGQGADELFGGYPWYRNVVAKEGYDRLREHMTQDLLLLYKETLEREDKISMAFSIESRVPFLDPKVVRASTSIDMKLNINDDNDILENVFIEN
jgi:asparagine synthase (glutamine-hydrolysing)